MWTSSFWKKTAELAIRGALHSVIIFWGVGDGILNAWTIDPKATLGVAVGGAALSVATSLAFKGRTEEPTLT